MKLGIDFGSSTTDFVVMSAGRIYASGSIQSKRATLHNVLTKVKKDKIDSIYATGGRAKNLSKNVIRVNEIDAIGEGGRYVSRVKSCLVVSVGSGTALVSVKGKKIKHIAGTAVGARTLLGLSKLILKTTDLKLIEQYATKGDLSKVDLMLQEIYPKGIGLYPPSATASHFGSIKNANRNDYARAIINMVAQSIGSLAGLGEKAYSHKNIVVTGKITQLKSFQSIMENRINTLFKIPVTIPDNSGIATAIGAVVAGLKKNLK